MSLEALVTLEPLDSFFFPDHRPFNQDDPGLAEAETRFPPPPHAVAGAIRFAIARQLGWHDDPRDWSVFQSADGVDLGVELGSGPFAAGNMCFGPPQLLDQGELLYPVPRTLVGRLDRQGELEKLAFVWPGEHEVRSNAPFARLPKVDAKDAETYTSLDGWWLSGKALKALLEGKLPPADALTPSDELVATGARVGLQTDYADHRAVVGRLYAAAHGAFRPESEPRRFACRVATTAASVLQLGHLPQATIIPFGSHGRAAEIGHLQDVKPRSVGLHAKSGKLRYTLSLLSPAWLAGGPVPTCLEALPGKLVSAVHDRPLLLGAWEHAGPKQRRYQRLYPTGSTWFFEATGSDIVAAKERVKLWAAPGNGIGAFTAVGFGAVVVGTW